MSALQKVRETMAGLGEQRTAALAAYTAHIKPVEDGGTPPEGFEEKRSELRAAVEAIDAEMRPVEARIKELEADEARSASIAANAAALRAANTASTEVLSEPTTYGPGSGNSYVADLARSSSPAWRGHYDAVARLNRAHHEVAVEAGRATSSEKRNQIESILRNAERSQDTNAGRTAMKDFRELGRTGRQESRSGMDTTTGSGGSFATPMYFVSQYVPFREAGRAFADQCNKQGLPEYGTTVYKPHVTGPAGVASQATQNTAIQETDPTAGYLSASLTTNAGQVTVSQQLIDRAGPNFEFDKMVFDQLNRAYAPEIDVYALNQALAGAGVTAYTASAFALTEANGTGGLYGAISGAKAAIRTAAGTFLNPSHLFVTPTRWEFCAGWSDSNGRPLIVPNIAGPFNAIAAGSPTGNVGVEGATGYQFNGLAAFTDNNLPAPTTGNDQAVVADMSAVTLFEGDPVTRAIPQTLAADLSVLLQLYSYSAVIVDYPLAVNAISGTGMAAPAF